MNSELMTVGKVIIAGAGCGDPELITVKAARWLQQADVVLTDRLVSNAIIQQYVPAAAEVIYVGKQCRRGFSTPQESINDMIKEYALQGKLVVRLKGGDVSLFSNILDELQVLAAYKGYLSYYYILKDNLAIATEVYNTIQLQYKAGIKTYLDVIFAETDLRSAQVNYTNALYQVISAKLDVQKELGSIQY